MKFENFNKINKKEENRGNHRERNEKKLKRREWKRRLDATLVVLGGGVMLTAAVEGTKTNNFLSSAVEKVKSDIEMLNTTDSQEDSTISWENARAEKEAADMEAELKDLEHFVDMIDYAEKNKPVEAGLEPGTIRLNEKGEYVTNEKGEYVKGDCFDATFINAGKSLMFSKFSYSGIDDEHITSRGGGMLLIDEDKNGTLDEVIILDTDQSALSKEEVQESAELVVKKIKEALKDGNKEALDKVVEETNGTAFLNFDKLSDLSEEEKDIYEGVYKNIIKGAAYAQQKHWSQGESE